MSHQPGRKKETYQTPILSILGGIREVTKATGKHGEMDGAKGTPDKTAP